MKKILVSGGFGAGWSTWNSGDKGRFMLAYQPIIDYIENGGSFSHAECHEKLQMHPLLLRLQKEVKEKFGEDYVCVLGADDLEVVTVDGLFRINEYDGSENVEQRDDVEWETA